MTGKHIVVPTEHGYHAHFNADPETHNLPENTEIYDNRAEAMARVDEITSVDE